RRGGERNRGRAARRFHHGDVGSMSGEELVDGIDAHGCAVLLSSVAERGRLRVTRSRGDIMYLRSWLTRPWAVHLSIGITIAVAALIFVGWTWIGSTGHVNLQLLQKMSGSMKPGVPQHIVEQYKAYVVDIGNLGVRYTTIQGLYVSIVAALVGLLSFKEAGQ